MIPADEMEQETSITILIGPAGQGKTVAACTASEYCPDVVPPKEKVYLKDTLFLMFDTNGIESARNLGLIPFVIDLSAGYDYRGLLKELKTSLETAKKFIETDGGKIIVVDTISALDYTWGVQLEKLFPDAKDTGRMYNKLAGLHARFIEGLRSIKGAQIIVTGHTKASINMLGGEDFDKKRKASDISKGDIQLDVTGKSARKWKGIATNVWPVVKKMGKYTIYTEPKAGFEAKTRLVGLSAEEPAHLRTIFTKAKGAAK